MQFLAARSLCTNFCKARYSIPLATCKHRLRRNLCTAPSWGENDYFVYDNIMVNAQSIVRKEKSYIGVTLHIMSHFLVW